MAQDPHSTHTVSSHGQELWSQGFDALSQEFIRKKTVIIFAEMTTADNGERTQEALQTGLLPSRISSTQAIPRRHNLPSSQIAEKRCRISPLLGFQMKAKISFIFHEH